jgi:hypothetical protein
VPLVDETTPSAWEIFKQGLTSAQPHPAMRASSRSGAPRAERSAAEHAAGWEAAGVADALRRAASAPETAAAGGLPRSGVHNVKEQLFQDPATGPVLALDSETAARWDKLDFLRNRSEIRSQRTCLTDVVHDRAVVRHDGAAHAHWARLKSCGRRACPVCGPRLAMRDADEIKRVVDHWRASGGKVVFGTFTVKHKISDELGDLVKYLQAGWHRVTSGRRWAEGQRAAGIKGWLRVQEEKFGYNGWHPHIHYLVFIGPEEWATVDGALRLLDEAFIRYSAGVVAAGGRPPKAVAQDVREIHSGAQAAEDIGNYISKQAAGRDERSAASIAAELTNRDGKNRVRFDRDDNSITPGEILTMATAGDNYFLAVWHQYETAMHGRRVIAWAAGFRESVPVPETTDEEAIEDAELPEVLEVLAVTPDGFRQILFRTTRAEVLRRIVAHGPELTREWLESLGVELRADDCEEKESVAMSLDFALPF